jgi:hypothetical protein
MNLRTASLLPRDISEHGHKNVHSIDIPWIYPAPRLADPVARGHGAGVLRGIGEDDKRLSGAMGGGKHITNAETSSDLLTTRSR